MRGLPPLTEYETREAVHLSQIELRTLQRLAPWMSIAPSAVAESCYDLKPDSHVGTLNLGTATIEIRPKLDVGRVLFLISYSMGLAAWTDEDFEYAERASLLEAIIPGFMANVRRAFLGGLRQGYRIEEAALQSVRGRVRFADQIRDRFGLMPPIEVRFDEFTEDIELNRLVKAALNRLGRLPIRSDRQRQSLRAFDSVLSNVTLVAYHPRHLPKINYTRLTEHYRPAVELAKLILRSTSFELGRGEARASTFIVDMNDVFEDFVVVALRDALNLSERSFPQGAKNRRLRLDEARVIGLEPDLSWWDGDECTFVGDVKYKRVSAKGVKHPDLYQVLAYAVAADLPASLLVYAKGEDEPVGHRVVHLGKRLEIVTLSLDGDIEDLMEQIDRLADKVRLLKDEAERGRLAA